MAAKSPEAIAHRRAYYKKYHERNREKRAARTRERLETEPGYREKRAAIQRAANAKRSPDEVRDYHREYAARWRAEHQERVRATNRRHRERNKEKRDAATVAWRVRNKEHVAEYAARYRAEKAQWLKERRATAYKPRMRAYHKERLATNPGYRASCLLRARVYKALKIAQTRKADTFWALVGCTLAELKQHLERQFAPGMTWKNIHIDHIRPLASFDLTDEAQQRLAFHFSNLQPLSPKANMSKGAKWDGQTALTV